MLTTGLVLCFLHLVIREYLGFLLSVHPMSIIPSKTLNCFNFSFSEVRMEKEIVELCVFNSCCIMYTFKFAITQLKSSPWLNSWSYRSRETKLNH